MQFTNLLKYIMYISTHLRYVSFGCHHTLQTAGTHILFPMQWSRETLNQLRHYFMKWRRRAKFKSFSLHTSVGHNELNKFILLMFMWFKHATNIKKIMLISWGKFQTVLKRSQSHTILMDIFFKLDMFLRIRSFIFIHFFRAISSRLSFEQTLLK